ncbi:glutathione S-transferase family protein [Mangrovibrevibacter kandeliae]|uniref:glutathione S-transferase family protein n=1 Tax=Mangrovibrevibacter kandeliae TaxID=2968473 RepID=UPI00211818AB|nr:glutathione S-transferase family protein [Aurantimonas sp. CSK15Z-1]MCQ8784133.1 glutathione S-transferase family protein [Aurantimonas sp. CSK15Z-1]
MSLQLFIHPFASYCWKVLIALNEQGLKFEVRLLDGSDAPTGEEFAERWPLRKMPILVDAGRTVVESTIIIEHLELHHAAERRLLPADAAVALDIRLMDRIFDTYIHAPMQAIVADALRPEGSRDALGTAQAKATLATAYAWIEGRLQAGVWACGESFTLADCAAAPALFYADWVCAIPPELALLRDYRRRLLARPSVARCVEDARPFRSLFPLGAPDRD